MYTDALAASTAPMVTPSRATASVSLAVDAIDAVASADIGLTTSGNAAVTAWVTTAPRSTTRSSISAAVVAVHDPLAVMILVIAAAPLLLTAAAAEQASPLPSDADAELAAVALAPTERFLAIVADADVPATADDDTVSDTARPALAEV